MLVERKVCFISDDGNRGPGRGWRMSVQRLTPPWLATSGARALIDKMRGGGACRNSTTNSDTHLQIGIGGLSSIILVVLGAVNLQFQRRQWHPTPELLPGKSHGRRSLVGCSPWGRLELDTTEATYHQQQQQQSSVPGSICSHFFEANSMNCGNLYHGYSLATV